MSARLLLDPTRPQTNCRYCVTWTGRCVHRRSGLNLWCDSFRDHAGPPNPEWLSGWKRCEKCFPQEVAA